jgi:hypothetical protein
MSRDNKPSPRAHARKNGTADKPKNGWSRGAYSSRQTRRWREGATRDTKGRT